MFFEIREKEQILYILTYKTALSADINYKNAHQKLIICKIG
jgi:hypothetical protein